MNNQYIIGFCGDKQSGKSTACNILKYFLQESRHLSMMGDSTECPHKQNIVTIEALARPLKEALSIFFNEDRGHFSAMSDKEKETGDLYNGVTPREAMQKFGTEFCRNVFGDDIHINLLIRRIDNYFNSTPLTVIQDIRFDNEVTRLVDEFGSDRVKIVKIERDKALKGDTHASERGVSAEHIDCTIANNGTIYEFRTNLEKFFIETFGRTAEFRYLTG